MTSQSLIWTKSENLQVNTHKRSLYYMAWKILEWHNSWWSFELISMQVFQYTNQLPLCKKSKSLMRFHFPQIKWHVAWRIKWWCYVSRLAQKARNCLFCLLLYLPLPLSLQVAQLLLKISKEFKINIQLNFHNSMWLKDRFVWKIISNKQCQLLQQ